MQTFWLDRIDDATGISGLGLVAEGVIFNDGTVAMRWLSDHTSTAIYSSIDEVEAIHGHNGGTKILLGGHADPSMYRRGPTWTQTI